MNTLTQHKKYAATIVLGSIEQFGTNKMIADELIKVGFRDVQVTGTGKERNATGIWCKPTITGALPDKAKKYIKEIVEL